MTPIAPLIEAFLRETLVHQRAPADTRAIPMLRDSNFCSSSPLRGSRVNHPG